MFTLHTPMPRSAQYVGLAAGLLLTISEFFAAGTGIEADRKAAAPASAVAVQTTETATVDRIALEKTAQKPRSTNGSGLAATSFSLASNY
jgi:hypothetical protein